MTATDEARKALIDMGCSCDVMHGYQCGLHGALTAYETIRDAEKREAGRREGLEQAAQEIDQCNREGPYNAIQGASRIRALITAPPSSSSDASHVEVNSRSQQKRIAIQKGEPTPTFSANDASQKPASSVIGGDTLPGKPQPFKKDSGAAPSGAQGTSAYVAGESFQQRVRKWTLECFGEQIADDKVERNHRFLEESLELVQALGCTASEAHQLVEYVFLRPRGNPEQECGGVRVTLAALCNANRMDMRQLGEVELVRVWGKIEKIRAKQAAKPKHSPLSEPMPYAALLAKLTVLRDEWGELARELEVPVEGIPAHIRLREGGRVRHCAEALSAILRDFGGK